MPHTRRLRPTQRLYDSTFGVKGSHYAEKVAILQAATVMLQAFGKLHILGSMAAAAMHEKPDSLCAFWLKLCFWAFLSCLCLNSLYPSVLLTCPSAFRLRLVAAALDAAFDCAYTFCYLGASLVAMNSLHSSQYVEGRSSYARSTESKEANIEQSFAFPTTFVAYCSLYMSLAHVVCVGRALERAAADWSRLPQKARGICF